MNDWVAIGSLAIAALTVILGYLDRRHQRSESLRSTLYREQVEAIREVLRLLSEFEVELAALVVADESGKRVEGRFEDTHERFVALRAARTRYDAILPSRTRDALGTLVDEGGEVLFSDEEAKRDAEVRTAKWMESHRLLRDAARRDLGVDPMGTRILELTGASASERSHLLVQSYRQMDERLSKRRSQRDSETTE